MNGYGGRKGMDGIPKGLIIRGPVHEGEAAIDPRRDAEAIKAASMGMVPEPQKGSSNGEARSQPEAISKAAARVSRKGAFATAWR